MGRFSMVNGIYTTWTTCSPHNTSRLTGPNILLLCHTLKYHIPRRSMINRAVRLIFLSNVVRSLFILQLQTRVGIKSLDWYCDARAAILVGIVPHTIESHLVLLWIYNGTYTRSLGRSSRGQALAWRTMSTGFKFLAPGTMHEKSTHETRLDLDSCFDHNRV